MSGNALADAFQNANKPTVPIQNPFDVMRAAGENAQLMNANKLFQAQQAAGAAQQNAIGPDGTYIPDRFRQNLLAAGPVAAPAAQSSLAANQALSSDQLNQARDKMGWIAKASQDALTKNDFSDAAMLKSLTQGSADGVLTMPEITKQLQTMPPDAAGRKAWLEQHQAQALSSQQHLDLHYGKSITADTGQQVVGGTQAVQGGALNIPPQPGVQLQTGPGANAAMIEVSDGAGNKYNVPRSSLPGASGIAGAPAAGGAAPPAPSAGGLAAGNPLLGGLEGQTDGTLQMPQRGGGAAPARGAVPGPPALPAGATLSQVAPATTAAATQTATQQAAIGTALVTRADQVPANKASYGNMLTDLAKLDTMGPGTGREATINGVLQKLTGYGITMDKSQVAGAESFAKIANMIAAQQLGSLGPTDARQSLAMGANPHLDLSKLGNTQIIHMLQGNEDAINAKAQAWQKWLGMGNSSGSYGQFSNDFNHNFDPRVFQQRYMGPKEIADLRGSMTGPGEAAKFKNDTLYARDQGWIK
jgi:hypothetical protein